MAKAIEQTPTLEGKDAERFLNILSNVSSVKCTPHEEQIKVMVKKIPEHLKL